MLIADGTDLNPSMLVRWQAYLSRTRKEHDPVFALWHALAALPEPAFADRARGVIDRLASADLPVNSVIARALVEGSPRSMADVARIYGEVLNRVEPLWQDAERRVALDGRRPGPLPVPALESLRRVFHGPDSPPEVPMDPFGDLALLPDRPSQAKARELQTALQKWLTEGPAPRRAP